MSLYIFLVCLLTSWMFGMIVRTLRTGSCAVCICGAPLRMCEQVPIISYIALPTGCHRCHRLRDPRVFEGELLGLSFGAVILLFEYGWAVCATLTLWAMCGLLDCAYRCIMPIMVWAMLGCSFLIHAGEATIAPAIVMTSALFLIYLFVFLFQTRSHPLGGQWKVEAQGFGFADLLLLCSMINMLSPLFVGTSFVYASLVHKFCQRLALRVGDTNYDVKSIALFPFAMTGVFVSRVFELLF